LSWIEPVFLRSYHRPSLSTFHSLFEPFFFTPLVHDWGHLLPSVLEDASSLRLVQFFWICPSFSSSFYLPLRGTYPRLLPLLLAASQDDLLRSQLVDSAICPPLHALFPMGHSFRPTLPSPFPKYGSLLNEWRV